MTGHGILRHTKPLHDFEHSKRHRFTVLRVPFRITVRMIPEIDTWGSKTCPHYNASLRQHFSD